LRSYLKEIALVQSGDGVPMVASTEYIVLRPKQAGCAAGRGADDLPALGAASGSVQVVARRIELIHDSMKRELLRLAIAGRVLIQQANEYVDRRPSQSLPSGSAQRNFSTSAKRAVEIAIEQDEKAALAYLKAQA
jgi:type I restriction enzyme S subunit